MKNRLSKILAASGVASRRASEELIFAGRVKLNGQVVKIPQTPVDTEIDLIEVNGRRIGKEEPKVHFMLNKPINYLCTNREDPGKKIVLDLFRDIPYRLFTVGRLDRETDGLLLVTNDGHFANSVIHPSFNVQKEYIAKTDKEIMHEHLIAISNGTLVEGCFVKPVSVEKVRRGTIRITVSEGKKREVRCLLESAGLDNILSLTRIRIGNLRLDDLPLGTYRALTEQDKRLIFQP